jgi:predicted transcriptional regulator
LKKILIAFIAGSLVTSGALGTLGYLKIGALNTENTHLKQKLKKLDLRHQNLTKNQASLSEELNGLKEKKAKEVDETIGALMQAKADAGIEALYELGVKALQAKDYPRAFFALAQVEKANPKFKEIEKFYPNSKIAYDKYQQKLVEDKLKDTFTLAYDQQAHKQFAQAKINYQRVIEMNPNYKDAKTRLAVVSQYLNLQQKIRENEQKAQWLEASYKLGLNEQNKGRFAQAKETYEAILKYAPLYKDTANRLKTVNARLPKTPTTLQNIKTPELAQSLNCYQKGLAFGKCGKLGLDKENCSADVTQLPLECKNNPDFVKGMKAAVGSSRSPASLLKDLPDLLKNL